MNELKFKTNINCGGCLSKVTPEFDSEEQIEKWSVDLESTDRTLTVETENLTIQDIKDIVQKVGFFAELIKQ